jgi:hypothetical protein
MCKCVYRCTNINYVEKCSFENFANRVQTRDIDCYVPILSIIFRCFDSEADYPAVSRKNVLKNCEQYETICYAGDLGTFVDIEIAYH